MNAQKKKVALGILRNPCASIHTQEEAEVTLRFLETVLGINQSLSAPEVNIYRQAAIIRTSDFSIDLVNPVVMNARKKVVSFRETCSSFPFEPQNCWRYKYIVLQTGIDRKEITLSDKEAILVQHEVDHLNGKVFFDHAIKAVIVRDGGKIQKKDFCPCGSKKRFIQCCYMS